MRPTLSQVQAAIEVLAKAREPMTPRAIVEQATAQGLWSSTGKTPDRSLYAAIIREINTKGKESRFAKATPGHFRLADHAPVISRHSTIQERRKIRILCSSVGPVEVLRVIAAYVATTHPDLEHGMALGSDLLKFAKHLSETTATATRNERSKP